MRHIKLGYILRILFVVAIILIAGGYELPKYAGRLTAIALLAVLDMLYWFSVQKAFTRKFRKALTVAYWTPLVLLLFFFILGIISPMSQWPAALRVYLPGILMVLLIGKGLFLSILVISDIFIIPLNAIRRIDPESSYKPIGWYRPRTFLLSAATIAGLVMLVFFSGMITGVNRFDVKTVEIKVEQLPEKFNGYKIVQISDLHLGSFVSHKPIDNIVKLVNAQHPDMIVFTGDLVNFNTDEAYPFEQELSLFKAPDGKFAILGNHDYGEYTRWSSDEDKNLNDKALFDLYQRTNWVLLRNQNHVIRKDGSEIYLAGVENWSRSSRFGKRGDVKKAIEGISPDSFTILLSHDPSHWDNEILEKYPDIDITLSGHTHAFQISLDTGKIHWSPAALLFRHWEGLYQQVSAKGNIQYLYVNKGAGMLGYPGRIGSKPEITVLILKK